MHASQRRDGGGHYVASVSPFEHEGLGEAGTGGGEHMGEKVMRLGLPSFPRQAREELGFSEISIFNVQFPISEGTTDQSER